MTILQILVGILSRILLASILCPAIIYHKNVAFISGESFFNIFKEMLSIYRSNILHMRVTKYMGRCGMTKYTSY